MILKIKDYNEGKTRVEIHNITDILIVGSCAINYRMPNGDEQIISVNEWEYVKIEEKYR